ncbi:MAG: hypothetical protein WC455_12635 [Dehalococcoidia bacterium]|jgi:hypothetical protein
MEQLYSWTCPGEDAGHCGNDIRGNYEGPCECCSLRKIIDRPEARRVWSAIFADFVPEEVA